MTLLGGGFGRKSKPDYAAEAAVLVEEARQAGEGRVDARRRHPSRLLSHDRRGVSQGDASTRSGKPTAWLQRSVVPADRLDVRRAARRSAFELDMGLDDTAVRRRRTSARKTAGADAHVRIGWFRAVTNNFHAFAAHSFADETGARRRSRLARVPARHASDPARSSTSRRRASTTRTTARRSRSIRSTRRRLRRVLEVAGEKIELGQAEARQRLGHRHRRASQLQHLRRVRGRSGSRRAGTRSHSAHRSGGRRRRRRSTPIASARSSKAPR